MMKKLGLITIVALAVSLCGCSKNEDAELNKDAANANVEKPQKLAGAEGMGGPGTQQKAQEGAGSSETSTAP